MKKTIITIATMAILSGPAMGTGSIFGGDTTNNHGGKGGKGGNAAAGAVAGAAAGAVSGAHAGASAINAVGLDLTNRNTNVGINGQSQTNRNYMEGQSSTNTNLIGGSSQSLSNDSSNRNYMEGQSQSQGNTQSMQYNEAAGVHYSGEYTVRGVPNAIAPSVQPTTPCAIPLNGAGSGVGFGISLGTAYVDRNCELREDVRLGLAGDAASQYLANQVIQQRLRAHLEEGDESEGGATGSRDDASPGGYAALMDY